MGNAKNRMEEEQDRGWNPPQKFACQVCVGDVYLRKLIRQNLTSRQCDYCQSKSRKSAPVQVIMAAVSTGLLKSVNTYEHAGCPYSSEDTEIQMYQTIEVLEPLLLKCNFNLLEDIANAFHNDQWVVAADGMWMSSHEHEELTWAWEQFVRVVKYETRFHFGIASTRSERPWSSGLLDISEVLPFLAKQIRTHRLTKTLNTGLKLFRIRIREDGEDWPSNARELGAPPPASARAGRMNPAGISYFYTALKEETALKEVGATEGTKVVVSIWETNRPMLVVDFAKLPAMPSPFDKENLRKREMILFLRGFLQDIAKRIEKDGKEHVEYVPTQVICEFISQVFKTPAGKHVDGILYSSSIDKGEQNLVLFPARGRRQERFDQVMFLSATDRELKKMNIK